MGEADRARTAAFEDGDFVADACAERAPACAERVPACFRIGLGGGMLVSIGFPGKPSIVSPPIAAAPDSDPTLLAVGLPGAMFLLGLAWNVGAFQWPLWSDSGLLIRECVLLVRGLTSGIDEVE